MDSTSALLAAVLGIVALAGAFFFGLSRGRKGPVTPAPPVPSPVQKREEDKVNDALARARLLKEEAEQLAGQERERALDEMHKAVLVDSKNLSDDPEALNAYLLCVGRIIRDD